MPNYFFTDSDGVKQGPLTAQRLQILADRGIITPTTPLETDTGYKGTAGQIPGLNFDVAMPPPFTQTPQAAPQATASKYPQRNKANLEGSVVKWSFDFAFRDLRLPVINVAICSIIYIICCIASILLGLSTSYWIFGMNMDESFMAPATFISISLVWLVVTFLILAVRLFCEWNIILLDWIIETKKAAQLYIENNKKEQE